MKKQTDQLCRAIVLLLVAPLTMLFASGCTSSQGVKWTGLSKAAPVTSQPWQYNASTSGQVLKTPHYAIYTTIKDPQVLKRLPQVMEGGYAQYTMFVDAPSLRGNAPMDCYVFSRRAEWADFTQAHTGTDSAVYLQITRGGYTIGDWFVSYYVGDTATFAVAAHEGWHQYVARHFKGRLPPFLEEGTACMFEGLRFNGDFPQWDLSINPNRALGLRSSIDRGKLWPLETLVAMHAGDVVRLPGDRIEAFYSQDWAFARFLWEYNNGQYRPAFKRLLADTAAGTPHDDSGTLRRIRNLWSPSSVKPMLEYYLGKPLDQIETEFQQFMHHIAYDQLDRQWTARAY